MNFGKWILLSFVMFAIFIGVLVTVCVRQDVNLVSASYYREELEHSVKMQKMRNAEELEIKPEISVSGAVVKISFPEFSELDRGDLTVLRPSDSSLDEKFALRRTSDRVVEYTLSKPDRGLYRIRMDWSMKGKDYFFEKMVVI
jgi:hypothetical protein